MSQPAKIEVYINVQSLVITRDEQGRAVMISGYHKVDEETAKSLAQQITKSYSEENFDLIQERIKSGVAWNEDMVQNQIAEFLNDDE